MSSTSREAREAIEPRLTALQAIVLGVATRLGEFIDEELFRELAGKMTENTVRPRRGELVAAGLVRDSGRRKKNSRGRACTLWEVCERHEEQGVLFGIPEQRTDGYWEGDH